MNGKQRTTQKDTSQDDNVQDLEEESKQSVSDSLMHDEILKVKKPNKQ